MHRIASHGLAAALALALLLGGGARAQEQEMPRLLAVTGTGEVEAEPDLATITAGVSSEAETAAAALAETDAAMTGVLAAVEAAGIAPSDVQTSQLSLEPVWANPPAPPDLPRQGDAALPQVVGYRASNMVTLRVRDVDALGGVIDAVTGAGANQLYGVGFSLADPSAQRDEARRRAVADARARAELLAEAAGVTLGAVQSIREGGMLPGPMPLAREQMAMDTPTAPGSVAVGAEVEIIFAIE